MVLLSVRVFNSRGLCASISVKHPYAKVLTVDTNFRFCVLTICSIGAEFQCSNVLSESYLLKKLTFN